MEYIQLSVTTDWDPRPNQDSTICVPVCFNTVGLVVLSPPGHQTSSIALQVNLESSGKSTEDQCCLVKKACSLAQHNRTPILSSVEGRWTQHRPAYWRALWRRFLTVIVKILPPIATKWLIRTAAQRCDFSSGTIHLENNLLQVL